MDEVYLHALLTEHPLAAKLERSEQEFIAGVIHRLHPSHQHVRYLVEQALDLALWQEGPLSALWDESAGAAQSGKQQVKSIIADVQRKLERIRASETDYRTFTPPVIVPDNRIESVADSQAITLLGRCPCPASGERNRCCNLVTLDAVQQCAFGCSYCSIQSFYHQGSIRVLGDLQQRLETLEVPEGTWHIGTGQASDSLAFGDDYGTLSALARFAEKKPGIIVELKTKSGRTDWIDSVRLPANIVATWSLNAPVVIDCEEHATATLEQRLRAARKAADTGIPVGFHLHPLVRFKGWQEHYRAVVAAICSTFDPSEVVMVSLGTLTFTKTTLRQLRSCGRPTRVTRMELAETFGKYSYPEQFKQELFSTVYAAFPEQWKSAASPFFYLCMESPGLWNKVFGWEYPDNASFEAAMRFAYLDRITSIGMVDNSRDVGDN